MKLLLKFNLRNSWSVNSTSGCGNPQFSKHTKCPLPLFFGLRFTRLPKSGSSFLKVLCLCLSDLLEAAACRARTSDSF